MENNIIIYRDTLLPYSETFIPAQVENYESYTGFYVGTSRCRGRNYPLPAQRTLVLSEMAKLTLRRKLLFLITGLGYPDWFRRLKQLSPRLIHAHFGPDGVWALPMKQRLKIPLIVTFHGYDITVSEDSSDDLSDMFGPHPLTRVYFWRRRHLFKKAHCCIAVSEFIRTKLIEKGCPPDKIIVHYIGIDVDKFTPQPHPSRQPVVLFVGRLVEKKGGHYLIQAMAQVQSVRPDIELVVIGDGGLRSTLEQQAAHALKRYRFLGAQPSDVVRDWLNQAMLLCIPSVTDIHHNCEGLPITLLEAQAMEVPVVSSIHAGIPEAIIHGETGFLAAEKDWQALGEHILTLANNEQLRKQFAIAGRQQVESKFNIKLNSPQIEAVYDRILQEPKAFF